MPPADAPARIAAPLRSPHVVTAALCLLIGLAAIVLSKAVPDVGKSAWSIPATVAVLGVFWRQRLRWVRGDIPPEALLGAVPERARRTALLLFGIALAFQLLRWTVDAGALGSKGGDDDERYIFLAYQILGHFDGSPVFAYRAPGWPLTIAALLGVFGQHAIWSVGLYQRVLLATLPPVFYLLLGRFLRRPAAVAAALLSLALPYNESIATVALADLSYTAVSLFALYALVPGLAGGRPRGWLAAAGLLMAGRTLLRLTGLGVALASAVALLVAAPGRLPRRLAQAALLAAPAVVAVLLLSGYNAIVSGHFKPGGGGSIAFLGAWASYFSRTPDTPPTREIAALVPEVPARELFRSWETIWIAQYRFTASGRGDAFDFGALADRAALDVVHGQPGEYVAHLANAAVITLLHPFDGVLPRGWRNHPLAPSQPPRFDRDVPACSLQTVFGAAVKTAWCAQNRALREYLEFRPRWIPRLPAPLLAAGATLTRTLPNRLRLLLPPFSWGMAVAASLLYLLAKPVTRRLAVLLLLPILAELAFPTVILADNSAGARYMLYVYPGYWVAAWLGAAYALEALISRAASVRSR